MEDPRVGLVLEDRYRIVDKIASGGTGVVYRAEYIGQARHVAIKFLHQSASDSATHRRRFRREAEAMSRLTHPNLCGIVGFGLDSGSPYLVMELVEGMSLRKVLESGPLEASRAVNLTRQILAGLASAHEAGVVHRDLKPGNVILAISLGDDHVKILDFGVAKLLGDTRTEVSMVTQSPVGTPQYMSPEQARATAVDARTDLYATGIMLYEMVTGKRPFDGGAGFAVLRMQVEDAPVAPRSLAPAISPQLESVIVKAMQKDPDSRFASAGDMAAALALVPEAAPPQQKRRETTEGKRRGRGLLVALLLILGAVTAGAWQAAARGWVDVPEWSPWQPEGRAVAIDVQPVPDAAPPPIDAPPPPPPWSPRPARVVLGKAPEWPEVKTAKLRGRVAGARLRPAFARLSISGDVATLRFDGADPAAADRCAPIAASADRVALELSLPRAALVVGERLTDVDGAELRGGDGAPLEARWSLELTRLEAGRSLAAGRVWIRGGARLVGAFEAVYCPGPREAAGAPPRVNGVRWNPDRAPDPGDLPSAAVAAAMGGRELVPPYANLTRASDPDRWVLSLFADQPVDRCAALDPDAMGVSVVLSPEVAVDEELALSAVIDAAPMTTPWVGFQLPGKAAFRGEILSLRIDEVTSSDVRGRIYAAAADRQRSVVAGAFRAVDCRGL